MRILDKAAAFLASALASMGVGGGGLFVIYLTLVKGMEQATAQGANLLFFLASALPPFIIHFFKRNLRYIAVLIMGISGIIGTFIGAYLLKIADPSVLRMAFGALLCFSGITVLLKKKK